VITDKYNAEQLWQEILRLETLLQAALDEVCVHNPCFEQAVWEKEVLSAAD